MPQFEYANIIQNLPTPFLMRGFKAPSVIKVDEEFHAKLRDEFGKSVKLRNDQTFSHMTTKNRIAVNTPGGILFVESNG